MFVTTARAESWKAAPLGFEPKQAGSRVPAFGCGPQWLLPHLPVPEQREGERAAPRRAVGLSAAPARAASERRQWTPR